MNIIATDSSELAKLMSASIAPVFLITGIAGKLSTMSLRYGRVIDRIRTLPQATLIGSGYEVA